MMSKLTPAELIGDFFTLPQIREAIRSTSNEPDYAEAHGVFTEALAMRERIYHPPTIDNLLETWQVHSPGEWENENTPTLGEWYAVSNEDGIIAYFGNESDACRFRIGEINRILNG